MHELSLAQSILDTAEQQAASHGAARVLAIRLRIGELTAIVDDALTFSFDIIAKGTRAEGAGIEIEHVPWQVRCGSCTAEYRVQEGMPTCPGCHTVGGETVAGRELQIVEMDVE